jgi:branched-subunit amino acid transport protein AzlD
VVRYLEEVIPPMVMVILVLYCLKDVKWGLFPNGIPELLGIGLVAGLHLWKGNALVSIFGGTAFYMVLVQSGVFS